MKKAISLILALVFTLSMLAGCSDAEVTLVEVTNQGISLTLPSDMTEQSDATYGNAETGDGVSFVISETFDPATWTQETVLTTYQSKYQDVVITDFENDLDINGNLGLVSHFTLTSAEGKALTGALVIVVNETNSFIITFMYGSDNTDGSLAANLDTCIQSITIA